MSTATVNGAKVSSDQRFTAAHPCPICRGHDRLKRGQGERCTGYLAADGTAAFCSRTESEKAIEGAAGTLYVHKLDPNGHPAGSNGKAKGRGAATLENAIRFQREAMGAKGVDPYVYHDAGGRQVGAVVRFNFPDGSKDYRPFRRNESGRWSCQGMPAPRPLYRLPEVIAARGLIVAEGEKAAKAIQDGLGLLATTAPHGAKSPGLADWRVLAGKQVVIWPDNDQAGEEYAREIIKQLVPLTPRPIIKVIRPPGLPEKGDAVEWIAAGGTKDDLLRMIESTPTIDLPRAVAIDGTHYYSDDKGVISYTEIGDDGPTTSPLTNFTARIVREVDRHEGGEVRKQYRIAARTADGATGEAVVEAPEYKPARWVDGKLGGRFLIHAGPRFGEHASTAIKMFSIEDGIPRETVYTSTGWVQHGGRWLYLHAGGAIGEDGPTDAVSVDLSPALAAYRLPDPPTDPERIRRAVGACLAITRLAKADRPGSRGAAAIVAAMPVRAILNPSNFSGHFSGTTGTRKTTIARLALQHFSTTIRGRDCPLSLSWRATLNGLQRSAYDAKDALLVVDELTGARAVETATEFFQDQGNLKSRDRMRQDGTMAPSLNPRCSVLSTGEADPDRQSALGRMLTVKFTPATVDLAELTKCQADADAGLYAEAMAAFVRWLAPRLDQIRAEHEARAVELAGEFSRELRGYGVHPRHPGIAAELASAYAAFLDFAQEVGAVGESAGLDRFAHIDEYLVETLKEQAGDQEDASVGHRFLRYVSSALSSGRYHLNDAETNDAPEPYEVSAGWHQEYKYDGGQQVLMWVPPANSVNIGRIDVAEGFVYLDPETAKGAARRVARDQGREIENLAQIGRELLAARLCEPERSGDKERADVRRMFKGAGRRRYFKIPAALLMGDEESEGGPSGPTSSESGPPDL